MKTRANGKPGRWGSFLLFFTSGIAIGVATAQAEPLATQTLTLKPGWNAVYAEVSPTGSLDSVFASWPTDSVGLYDPARLLETAQFSSESETQGLSAAPFATWRRSYPELSDAQRIAAGTVLLYFGTNSTDFVTSIVGVPAAPRMKWHEAGTSGLYNYIGFSLRHGAKVLPSDYLDGFNGEYVPNRVFYRFFGRSKTSSPSLVKVSSNYKVSDGEVLAMASDVVSSWSGVLFVSPRNGLDYDSTEVRQTLKIRNDSTIGRTVRVAIVDDAANRQDVALPWSCIHVRDADSLVTTNAAWTACTNSVIAEKFLRSGKTWQLQIGLDRRAMQDQIYGKSFGAILRITDEDGESCMRVDVPICGTTSGGTATAKAWPKGLWVGEVKFDKVRTPGDEAASETGGTLKLRLPVHVDENGKIRLLQRVVAAGETDSDGYWNYRLYAGAATPPSTATSLMRISAVCLPTETPIVEAEEADLASGTAKFRFTVAAGGATSLLRHPRHPQHDGLRWDFKTAAPDGDDWTNYKYDVKPETFSVKNEISLALDFSGGAAVWSPEDEVKGTCEWSFEGLRHEGALVASGTVTFKRVSQVADVVLE